VVSAWNHTSNLQCVGDMICSGIKIWTFYLPLQKQSSYHLCYWTNT